ncbi:MAG TPA: 50S ribosomal protein L25/general stress protein Ctc [Bacteroidales bacterium]|nr:50S ribosomal protein L25/general stress protein Ctc [Bacteroidales bacterium]HRZ49105.1 50S ribosomal protein L25/general stress protein Ctc [Bacteroidales bacterium]
MKIVKLSGSPRENVGKKDARSQRKEGRVPCVIYGGKEQVHFSADEKEFGPIVFTPDVMFVEIELGSQTYKAILQDIQYHPVSDKIIHADFMELHDEKAITMSIPIYTTGTSKGVLRGGKLVQGLRRLPVKALPAFMPERITVDVTKLNIGHSFKVKDLKLSNVTVLSSPFNTLVSVKTARGVVAGADEEEEVGDAGAEG